MSYTQHPLVSHGPRTVYGVLVHTTGNGVPDLALKHPDKSHLTILTEVYSASAANGGTGPHYAIDPLGAVVQFRDPGAVSWHAGVSADQRRNFLDGSWQSDYNRIDKDVVSWWRARWPGKLSPSHLYPSRSPNTDFVGIELMPCGAYAGSSWEWKWGTRPGFDKQRFSVEQYVALARLCKELAVTYSLDLGKSGVLLGHEDVNPYTRPGWDVGDKIEAFSWRMLRGLLGSL